MEEESQIGRRCERAVITAYSELRQIGSDDMSAFQACTALYRIHHPEASISEARRLVAEWIDHHLVRKAPGPTDGCPLRLFLPRRLCGGIGRNAQRSTPTSVWRGSGFRRPWL